MHHLKIDATTWVNHNSDWSGDVQVCWDGREAWIPGSVIVAAGKAQADAEMLVLLKELIVAEDGCALCGYGHVGDTYHYDTCRLAALLKRLGE